MQPQQQAPQPEAHPPLRDSGHSKNSDSSSDDIGGSDRNWPEIADGPHIPSMHSDSNGLPDGASGGTLQQSAPQQNEPVRLFVAVISMAANKDRRDAVRATWGSDQRCDCHPHLRAHQLPLQVYNLASSWRRLMICARQGHHPL